MSPYTSYSLEKVKGVVRVVRENPGTGEAVGEMVYAFESTMEMEPNRVLYLTVEIPEVAKVDAST